MCSELLTSLWMLLPVDSNNTKLLMVRLFDSGFEEDEG